MKEEYRQIAHMFFGLLIAAFIYFTDKNTAIYAMGIVVIVSVAISDAVAKGIRVPLFSEIISTLERDNTVAGKGTILFFISILFCLLFFDKNIVFAAVLVLAVLDSVSTIAGVRLGKTKIYGKKSLEGTFAGFMAGFIVLLPFMAPLTAAAAAFAGSLTELLSPVDDNLTVPPVICLLLYAFQYI